MLRPPGRLIGGAPAAGAETGSSASHCKVLVRYPSNADISSQVLAAGTTGGGKRAKQFRLLLSGRPLSRRSASNKRFITTALSAGREVSSTPHFFLGCKRKEIRERKKASERKVESERARSYCPYMMLGTASNETCWDNMLGPIH
jgi:hypothetical protein